MQELCKSIGLSGRSFCSVFGFIRASAGVASTRFDPRFFVVVSSVSLLRSSSWPAKLGRSNALVGVGGRHPDVDDRDVWLRALDELEQLFRVGRDTDDLESRFVEQAREPSRRITPWPHPRERGLPLPERTVGLRNARSQRTARCGRQNLVM
jgi:hypothetical protein